jgi:uncharacterized protein with FMN-binding domain
VRTRAAVSASLASLGILAVGWQAGAHTLEAQAATPTSATTGTGTTSGAAAGSSSHSASGNSSGSTSNSSSGSSTASGTFAGRSVSTRFGNVQVQITVQNGKITDVTALHLTDAERRSQMISAQAAPILRSEVLQAQSANVQTVSGATITSDAYLTSLQAALDAAHL